MEVTKTRTVRFDALVNKSGAPEQVTLWTKPEDDADFMKAVRAARVVTVIQHNVGTKKDHGLVGFRAMKNAFYLVFPKPLDAATNTKVVGIKYGRVLSGTPKGPIFKAKKRGASGIPMRESANYVVADEVAENRKPAGKVTKAKEAKRSRFKAAVELVGKQTATIEVEAKSKSEAVKLLNKQAAELQLDCEHAKAKRKVKTIRKT